MPAITQTSQSMTATRRFFPSVCFVTGLAALAIVVIVAPKRSWAEEQRAGVGMRELSLNQTTSTVSDSNQSSERLRRLKEISDPTDAGNPHLVTVSLGSQQLTVYKGFGTVHRTNVSSGKRGHETPTGIFSILEKRRYHKSNIYSNAPMPLMQRLTWSGIALHESGSVPNRPASHGCVRLPAKAAEDLFSRLERGTHVVISDEDLLPKTFSHPKLFQPRGAGISLAALRTGIAPDGLEAPAQTLETPPIEPLRIYITRKTRREIVQHLQELLSRLEYPLEKIDGLYGRETAAAVIAFQKDHDLPPTGMLTEGLLQAAYQAAGVTQPPPGIIYVRQDHRPIFEAEIGIKSPQEPLGTHLLLATNFSLENIDWMSLSIPTRIPPSVIRDHKLQVPEDRTKIRESLAESLERLTIPTKARKFIERHLTNGSSIAISDNGLGTETGKGTDFIVQTF